MKPSLYTVYCIGQAGHGRGKDDSCGSTMAIYINYLSMLEGQKYLSVKGGGGNWRGGGGGERIREGKEGEAFSPERKWWWSVIGPSQ